MSNDISRLRKDYSGDELSEEKILNDPYQQFKIWLDEAIALVKEDANATVLSTVSADERPSSRVVLLKSFDENGFVFYSNYTSRKGEHLKKNPYAALLFFWSALQRQVRIEGFVRQVVTGQSDAYFQSRPFDSKVSACISPQSTVIPDRQWLEDERQDFISKHNEKEIKRPFFWGGYCLEAERIEFWQGRPGRLHDRLEFYKDGYEWKLKRLAP